MVDNLNAEIALGTVTSVPEAVQWLGYSYLYIRMLRNPLTYGIDWAEIRDDPTLVSKSVVSSTITGIVVLHWLEILSCCHSKYSFDQEHIVLIIFSGSTPKTTCDSGCENTAAESNDHFQRNHGGASK
jgi:hypothetical protein